MKYQLFGMDDTSHGKGKISPPFAGTLRKDGRIYLHVGTRNTVAEYHEIPEPRDITEELK